MLDVLIQFASGPMLPMAVLSGAIVVVIVEAIRVSPRALWGDLFSEDFDD